MLTLRVPLCLHHTRSLELHSMTTESSASSPEESYTAPGDSKVLHEWTPPTPSSPATPPLLQWVPATSTHPVTSWAKIPPLDLWPCWAHRLGTLLHPVPRSSCWSLCPGSGVGISSSVNSPQTSGLCSLEGTVKITGLNPGSATFYMTSNW